MKTSKNGIQFIEREEGVILYAYDDFNDKKVPIGGTVKGTITIGTGHTSAAGLPKVVPGMVITRQEADAILAKDLTKVEDNINKLVKVPLTQNQFDAIVSFDFNTGGFGRSTVLRKLNAGDYAGAADAFLMWSKANGNPTLLLPRRQREKALFLKPDSTPKTVPTGTGTAAATAVGGGLVYTYWHAFTNHWVLYTVAAAAIAVAIDTAIYMYKNRKNKNGISQETVG